MSAQGMFSVGGIASGLDTNGIISQLMQIERQPIVRIQNTQASLRKVDDAWSQVNTRLSALRTATDAINRPDRFTNMVAVTSSNTDAVAVARGSGTQTGALSFRVTQLAQSHQLASASFGGADAALDAGTFSVTIGGKTVDVELDGAKTLADLAKELNAAKGGFAASIVKVTDGEHRLVLTGNATGAANGITVASSLEQFDGVATTTLRVAQDAEVIVGNGAEPLTIRRASNTITDLVPGASITLKKTTGDTFVDVTSSRDVEGGVRAVKEYVDALNAAINTISGLSRYNAETKQAAALQGDSTARQLLSQLRSAVSAPLGVERAGYSSAWQVGLGVDRHGAVTLDETKLRAALNDDFDAVGRLFGRTGTADVAEISGVAGTGTTKPGSYEVEVTSAATAAKAVGATYSPPGGGDPKTFRIMTGGTTVVVTISTDHLTAADVIAEINKAIEAAGVSSLRARAGEGGEGDLVIESTQPGSATSFTVEQITGEGDEATVVEGGTVFGLEGVHTGLDATGRIRPKGGDESTWVALTGQGRTLSAKGGPAAGLAFTWTGQGASAGVVQVDFTQGLAGNMGAALSTAEGSFGSVARARQGISNQIRMYDTRIEGFEHRLTLRESTLVRQFTAMETALSRMNSQMSWLSSQLSSLNGLNEQR